MGYLTYPEDVKTQSVIINSLLSLRLLNKDSVSLDGVYEVKTIETYKHRYTL